MTDTTFRPTLEEATAIMRRIKDVYLEAEAATALTAYDLDLDPTSDIVKLLLSTAVRTRRGKMLADCEPEFFKSVSGLIDFEPESTESFRAGSLEGAVVVISQLANLIVELSDHVAEINLASYAAYCYFALRSPGERPDLERLLGPHKYRVN